MIKVNFYFSYLLTKKWTSIVNSFKNSNLNRFFCATYHYLGFEIIDKISSVSLAFHKLITPQDKTRYIKKFNLPLLHLANVKAHVFQVTLDFEMRRSTENMRVYHLH